MKEKLNRCCCVGAAFFFNQYKIWQIILVDTQFSKWILCPLRSVQMFPLVSVGATSCPDSLPLSWGCNTRADTTGWHNDFCGNKAGFELRLRPPARQICQTLNHLWSLLTRDKLHDVPGDFLTFANRPTHYFNWQRWSKVKAQCCNIF